MSQHATNYSNLLLRALSESDRNLIRPHLESVELQLEDCLEEPGKPVEYAYFMESGLASTVGGKRGTNRDRPIEVGVIGREGVTGLCVILGGDLSPLQKFIQVAGRAERIRAADFRDALSRSPSLHGLLLKFVQVFMIQISETAVCNGHSNIEERLARWILMADDRLDTPTMPLTHEFLAIMLGVRRAGVTVAIHALESCGLIKAERGQIRVVDRQGLEKNAGDSYGVPEQEYRRLIQRGIAAK